MSENQAVAIWVAVSAAGMIVVLALQAPLWLVPIGVVSWPFVILAIQVARSLKPKIDRWRKHRAFNKAIAQGQKDFRLPLSIRVPGGKESDLPSGKANIDHGPISCAPNKYLQSSINLSLYEFRNYKCWKCDKDMIVFNWKRHQMYQQAQPPAPLPQSVQYRWSRTMDRRYWVNVCLDCDAIQGDFAVFVENQEHLEWQYVVYPPYGVISG